MWGEATTVWHGRSLAWCRDKCSSIAHCLSFEFFAYAADGRRSTTSSNLGAAAQETTQGGMCDGASTGKCQISDRCERDEVVANPCTDLYIRKGGAEWSPYNPKYRLHPGRALPPHYYRDELRP